MAPHESLFDKEHVKQTFLVNTDPFSPMPLHIVIFHQNLKKKTNYFTKSSIEVRQTIELLFVVQGKHNVPRSVIDKTGYDIT